MENGKYIYWYIYHIPFDEHEENEYKMENVETAGNVNATVLV